MPRLKPSLFIQRIKKPSNVKTWDINHRHIWAFAFILFFCEKKPTTSIAARSFVLVLLLLKAFSFSEGFAHERLRRL